MGGVVRRLALLLAVFALVAAQASEVGATVAGKLASPRTCVASWAFSSGPIGYTITDFAPISHDDVWATGVVRGGDQSIVAHWDGSAWTVTEIPGATDGGLSAMALISPTDIWAVGTGPGPGIASPLTVHFDGSSWSIVPSPVVAGSL